MMWSHYVTAILSYNLRIIKKANVASSGWKEHKMTEPRRKAHLPEDERFSAVDGIQAVVHHHPRPKLLADGVGGEAVHVHLHVGADLLIRQKLAWNHLRDTHWTHFQSIFYNGRRLQGALC